MGTHFRHFNFPDDKSTFHYINPCHEAVFRIPGETQVGNEFFLDGTFDKNGSGFLVIFQEDETENSSVLLSYEFDSNSRDVTMTSPNGETLVEQGMECFFTAGGSFRMHIILGADFYEVKINSDEPTVFPINDKNAMTEAHYISISGDIQIRSFHIQKNAIEKGKPYMTIPDNAKIGDIFTFYGITPGTRKDPKVGPRIIIEFQDAPGNADDVWFHFNPRFDWHGQTTVVRNTYIKGGWGKEEFDKGKNPLPTDATFILEILVEKEQFRCWLNGAEFCTYKHRLPFEKITKVKTFTTDAKDNLCNITSIVMSRMSCRTPLSLGYECVLDTEKILPNCLSYFPKLPLDMKLPQPLDVGSCIYISGVFKKAHSFKFSLSNEVMDMTFDFDKQTVTFIDDNIPITVTFPFHKQGYFDMQIFCNEKGELIVSVDDVQLDVYQPRTDCKIASRFTISGDVRVNRVATLRL